MKKQGKLTDDLTWDSQNLIRTIKIQDFILLIVQGITFIFHLLKYHKFEHRIRINEQTFVIKSILKASGNSITAQC